MAAAGVTVEQLAERVGYHPKQVGRWVSGGQVPRRAGAKADVARVLGRNVADIWPHLSHETAGGEIVQSWPRRADAPADYWWTLLTSADDHLDLVAYAALFLPEQHPRLIPMIREKAAGGCEVRIALVDPECQLVADRAVEEGMPLVERVRYGLRYFEPLADVDGVEIRLHETPLYASVFRADDQAFWTPHLYGIPGPFAPLLYVRRIDDHGIHASLVGHIDRVWETAKPWPGSTTSTTPTPRRQTA